MYIYIYIFDNTRALTDLSLKRGNVACIFQLKMTDCIQSHEYLTNYAHAH